MFGKLLSSAKSAVVGGPTPDPECDVVWPGVDVSDASACKALVEKHHAQFEKIQADKWALVPSFKDPEEGGDMHLWDREQQGSHHCVKVTFSVQNTSAKKTVDLVSSTDMAIRGTFSADCTGMKVIEQPIGTDAKIVYVSYYTPPPVAHRDFCFLMGTKEHPDGTIDTWGCTVQSDKCPEVDGYVRGTSFFGWKVTPVGDTTMVSYTNVFDPRGWTPGFVLNWLKSTCAKELSAVRAVLSGKKADVGQTSLADCGIDAKEVADAQAAEKK